MRTKRGGFILHYSYPDALDQDLVCTCTRDRHDQIARKYEEQVDPAPPRKIAARIKVEEQDDNRRKGPKRVEFGHPIHRQSLDKGEGRTDRSEKN
jgi:hypothetical protein